MAGAFTIIFGSSGRRCEKSRRFPMPIANEVAIIGTGTIKFGENFHQSYNDMLWEAVNLAFKDAKVEPKDIQAGWLGTYLPFSWGYEGGAGASLAEALHLYDIPLTPGSNYS